mmetsp:Transcript_122654/g.308390  ORF Transcript_122654/g.308390 Transcript_122654/m.308390 type:complete len:459 (+) Transcript_122654:102-1478(+)
MTYPAGLAVSELNAIRAELNARRLEAASYSRAIEDLEVRMRKLETSAGITGQSSPLEQLGAPAPGKRHSERQLVALMPDEDCSSESESLELSGGEEDVTVFADEDPPESFFTYCTVMMTARSAQVRNFAALQLVVFIVLLVILSGCWMDASANRRVTEQWGGVGGTYKSACFYQGYHDRGADAENVHSWVLGLHFPKKVNNLSFPFVIVGAFCLVLLALYLKDASEKLLFEAASAEASNLPLNLKVLVVAAEISWTVVVPIKVAVGAAVQLSMSYDVLDIILNAFAATFLFDLDGTLYALALSPGEKARYERQWKTSPHTKFKRDAAIPNYIFTVDTFLLLFLFLGPHLHSLDWTDGLDYQFELKKLLQDIVIPCAILRVFLVQLGLLRMRDEASGKDRAPSAYMHLMLKTVFGAFVGMFIHIVYKVFLGTDTVYDYAAITSCLNGSSTSACTCYNPF